MATLREVSVGSKKVDCVAEQSLCRDMGIQGFPTVVLCDRGNAGGPRSEQRLALCSPWRDI